MKVRVDFVTVETMCNNYYFPVIKISKFVCVLNGHMLSNILQSDSSQNPPVLLTFYIYLWNVFTNIILEVCLIQGKNLSNTIAETLATRTVKSDFSFSSSSSDRRYSLFSKFSVCHKGSCVIQLV